MIDTIIKITPERPVVLTGATLIVVFAPALPAVPVVVTPVV
jgi:hypothetical protein